MNARRKRRAGRIVAASALAAVGLCALGEAHADAPLDEAPLLEALGYADWSEEPAVGAGGVRRFDAALASRGYNLVSSRPVARATLLDMDGRVVHVWSTPELPGSWENAELAPDDDLFVLGK